jgi:hypothetical protein
MTKIKDYDIDGVLTSGDKWVGTDENGNRTVNFSVGDVTSYILDQVENGSVDDSPRILVNMIQAGSVIDGQGVSNDNPAKAINRSFRTQIAVSKYEILLFQVQRQVVTNTGGKENYRLLTEQYYYRGGEGTINGDLDETDWKNDLVLDYSIEQTETLDPPTKGSPAETETVPTTDTSDPASTITASATLIALDNDAKHQYVALYDTTDSLDYKFYQFTGPAGNYGSGGLTATAGMFTEITQVEEVQKTKLSEFINDGDGANEFATADLVPTNTSDLTNDSGYITSAGVPSNTSDLTNDGDGVNAFATVDQLAANTSDLTNDGDGVNAFATVDQLAANTSDLANDGSGSGVFVEVINESSVGVFPYMKQVKVTVTASAVRNGNSVPIQVAAAPGASYAWKVASQPVAEHTWGSIAFDGGGDVNVKSSSAVAGAHQYRLDPAFLASTADIRIPMDVKSAASDTSVIPNDAIVIQMGADSTVGDSTQVYYVTLELIQL